MPDWAGGPGRLLAEGQCRRACTRFTAAIPAQEISMATMPATPPPVVPSAIAVIGIPIPMEAAASVGAVLGKLLNPSVRDSGV